MSFFSATKLSGRSPYRRVGSRKNICIYIYLEMLYRSEDFLFSFDLWPVLERLYRLLTAVASGSCFQKARITKNIYQLSVSISMYPKTLRQKISPRIVSADPAIQGRKSRKFCWGRSRLVVVYLGVFLYRRRRIHVRHPFSHYTNASSVVRGGGFSTVLYFKRCVFSVTIWSTG